MQPKTHKRTEITVNRTRVVAASRPTAYVVANGYLELHAILANAFGMLPVKQLLYVTVATAAVQRVMRGNVLPAHLRDATPMPAELVGHISRRALAAATGLPRETVRRLVNEMLADGLLSLRPGGGLAAQAGLLAQPKVQRAVMALVDEFGAVANRLLQLGVFEVQA